MKAIRSCVVCGKKCLKWGLIRLAYTGNGRIVVDVGQRLPGRGAYICPEQKCVQNLGKRRELDRAFRRKIEASLYETLRNELETVVHSSKVESLVGLAFRAGKVALGTAAVEEMLHKKKAKLLILAKDISTSTERHFGNLAENSGIPILKIGTKAAWGASFKRKELGVLAVLDRNFARGILGAEKS